MNKFLISPKAMINSFWLNRNLILNLIRRSISCRYRGSMLGSFWALFTPVMMLAVYTFVFSVVFDVRWGTSESSSKAEFALLLFAGLIVFNYFAEVVNGAPSLILTHSNYVKKVVFPLEVLPWVSVLSALFNVFTSLIVWMIFYIYAFGLPTFYIVEVPIVLIPLIFLCLGLSFFLSALGVYLRDVGQIIGIATTMIMFLSPIFYPLSAIPEKFRFYLELNPLAPAISSLRSSLYSGEGIIYSDYAVYLLVSLSIAYLGFVFFQKTRKGFADVL